MWQTKSSPRPLMDVCSRFLSSVIVRGRAFLRASSSGKTRCFERVCASIKLLILAAAVLAAPTAGAWDRTYLLGLLNSTPDGGWVKANTTTYSSAWATGPVGLPDGSYSNPASVVHAWSSFGWDSLRGRLMLYGGGHANYMGNEVYVWQGTNGVWTRGSLPSRLEQWGSSATFYVVDNAAPQSAHTYDNNIYVPLNDLFVTFGGASFNTGGVYTNKGPTGAPVRSGPWMWDPAKADPNKVGGTTGSGYNPPTVGGNMWSNQQGRWIGNEPPSYVDGATAYAQEGGKDVIYVSAQPGSGWPSLFRYELGNVRAGGIGRYEQVGVAWNAPGFQNTATIDSTHGLFIRTADIAGLFTGLGVWDLTQSNAANPDANRDIAVELVLPNGTPFTGTRWFGIDYDPNNDKILLWDGLDRGTVWETRAQFDASGAVASPWVVTQRTSTTAAQPSGDFVTGVLGKWRFVPELGAFIALDEFDSGTGDAGVWLYRPVGWTNPIGGNLPPTVTLTSPANGTSVSAPATVVLSANASDSNGTVARVDFYAGSTLIGSDTTSPYSVTWSNVVAGSYTLTAVAVDNLGASTTSSPVSLNVTTGTTATLQDGVGGYTGTRDTYLSSWSINENFGTAQSLLEGGAYTYLFRFAIFQSEGGPVPNGATIVSATLSLYKSSFYDYTYQVSRMLRNWNETQATWSQWQAGQGWSVAGADGVGTDYAATPVATVSAGWTPGWLNANVTAGVQAMSTGTPNYGWRLVGVSGNGNDKTWWSGEYTANPTLRPKLVIQYSGGSSNVPPTVTLTSPANGTSVSAPATVVVSANASDSNGTVARVDFYAGSTLIGSDTTAPYSVTWSNVVAGSYTLTAVAVDNLGASTTSSPVSLTVTTGTTVRCRTA